MRPRANPLQTADARRGFTLIEVMAVLLLVALISAVAVVALAGRGRAMRLEDAVEQIRTIDRTARQRARQAGEPARITFDIRAGEVRAAAAGNSPPSVRLGAQFRLATIMLPGRRVSFDEASVEVSAQGRSTAYAVQVVDAADRERSRWIFFAGLTPQAIELNDERDAQDIFTALLSAQANVGDDAR